MPTDTIYTVTGSELTSIADAIRTKGDTSASLAFPSGFVEAIGDISGGGTVETRKIYDTLGMFGNAIVWIDSTGTFQTNVIADYDTGISYIEPQVGSMVCLFSPMPQFTHANLEVVLSASSRTPPSNYYVCKVV